MAANGDFDNITLYGPSQAQIIEQLRSQSIHGYVSPTIRGITVVHADGWFQSLEKQLSITLACVAMRAMVRDEAVLWYQIYDTGILVDDYNSFPGFMDDEAPAEPMGGDTRRLCEAFKAGDAVETVRQILREDWYEGGAHRRHSALIEALHLPVELFGPEAIDDAGFVQIKSTPLPDEDEIPSPW